MRAFLVGVAIVSVVVGVGPGGPAAAQDGLTKRDAQGLVTVDVTVVSPSAPGAPVKVKIVLDTHSAALDGVAFERAVAMRTPDGSEVPPVGVEQASGSGHHREAVLVFPPLPPAGSVRIVVRNVGGVPERTFTWESLPR